MLEVDFQLKRGDFLLQANQKISAPITGISGPSGSGKSTLLATIAGLIKPESGKIILDNNVLVNTEQRIFIPAYKRRIGLVFQNGQLFPHFSVRNNLLYGYNNISAQERLFLLEDIVALLEIDTLLERRPLTLSGGEQQRVALGRAILYSPSLLLLDEPLSALDERLKKQILPFFLRIKNECKIPMIYVTHALSEVEFLTENHLLMENGKLQHA